jgi:hypothetical protein
MYGDYEILGKEGHSVSQKRDGSRIAEIKGKPDIRKIICDVLETRTGKIAVCSKLYILLTTSAISTDNKTACANQHVRYSARKTVAQNVHRDIRYLEFDFQPAEPKACIKGSESLQYQCRGIREA